MSAGSLIGAVMLTVFAGGLFIVMGDALDIISTISATTFATAVVYEDGIVAYNMINNVFGYLPIIIFIGAWGNHFLTVISERSQEV